MTNNFDAEAAKRAIFEDNVNVTEPNHLKDLAQILINIVLIIVIIYLFIYTLSGVLLTTLSPEKQIIIEKLISPKLKTDVVEISQSEQARIDKIKHNILKIDYKFPKTSNLDIKVIKNKQLNALCYPNGNIYITSELFKHLSTDEQLTFVIAHELGHYRHKDHLLNLRRNISNSIVLIIASIASPNTNLSNTLEGGLNIVDLKYSRGVEAKADLYAIKIMNALYGSAKGGVEVMNILKEGNRFDIEFLSSHPNIDKRIKTIEKYSK